MNPTMPDSVHTTTSLQRLVKVNAISFFSQVVQIGTVPALLALRLNEAQYSSVVVGIVAAAPWIAILLMGQWTPVALRRYGFVATNWIALTMSMLSLMGTMFATSPPVLFAVNFVLGIALILRWVACDTWVVAVAPECLRGRAIGTHETLMGCGIAAGPLVIAFAGATTALPILCCMGMLVLSGTALSMLQESDGHPEIPMKTHRLAVVRVLPTALMAGFLAGFIETSSISFLPVFGARGLFALGATTVLTGFGAGGTLLQVPLGWLADKAGFRVAQLITASVIGAGALALPYVAQHSILLLALLFIWGGAAGGMNTLAVVEAGYRSENAGVSTAMMAIALAYTVGSVSGPVLTGLIILKLPEAGFAVTMGAAALAFLLIWTANRSKAPPASVVVTNAWQQ
jgi:MFS family permease